ncbi:MAG TPA: phosphate acyltransferase PlsX [Polyangia bacterium]|jgi:glycerol-3-phosphate acyltransferase PlsX|nr:phosphate acyltransferase PlsX [Polyangia bacterium]
MPRIAVDAMGSDAAPRVEVEGVVAAVRARGLEVILVGDETRLRAELEALGATREPIVVRHAPDVITMHDAPSMAVKQKKKSSMRVCFDLVKAGEADAVVSAGNSGAMMACGMLVLGRLPGVERPAIVTTFPTRAGECALLDMGANIDPKPAVLAQFGVLGAVYARLLHGKARPRVGLLSNGSEEHKGTPLTREAHQILARAESASSADFSYVGYVEGRDIFQGEVDVVVTDGFTGNVVLKCVEGAAETMLGMVREEVSRAGLFAKLGAALMTGALRRLRERTDYAEHGGAPLLGVDGVALICHGGSTVVAIKNAVYVADRFAQLGLGKELAAAVARNILLWEGAPPAASGAGAVS